MSKRKITNFFTSDSTSGKNLSQNKEKVDGPCTKKRVNTSLKTVEKWERELGISLRTESAEGSDSVSKIFCTTCVKYMPDQTTSFVTGCTSVKKESVKFHRDSVLHQRAIDRKAAQEKLKLGKQTPLMKGLMKLDEIQMEKMEKLFRTAKFIASNAKPFTDFEKLCKLQNDNGLMLGNTYINDKACVTFITHIAGCLFDDLKTLLNKSLFLSIYCDGTTDNSNSEKEVILVKILDEFYPKIVYLSLKEPVNTKAEGIVGAINEAFSDFDMINYKQKMIGFCSDGASVMMGQKAGVIKKIKDEGPAPWALSVWCLAHRLELALKDSFKGEYLDNVVEVLTSIYYFYKGSAKRNREAEEIADIMDMHFTKPERCNGTRWVDHKLRAISKLIFNWKIIIMHMMSYSQDDSNAGQYRAKAQGILKKMLQYKFVWFLHFMKDLLNEIAKVSLQFQREDITLSSAVTKLQAANEALRHLQDHDGDSLVEFRALLDENMKYHGEQLKNMVNDNALNEEKRRLVQSVNDCVNTRLDNIDSDPLYLSCHAFDPTNWPNENERQALMLYGNEEVNTLCCHFQEPLNNAGCNIDLAKTEWKDLKIYISRNPHFTGRNPLSVYQRVSQDDIDRNKYQNIMLLIHLTSLYPLSNASCERAFSVMKRIKDDWRCSLNTDTMDMLMRIEISEGQFQPRRSVERWWISGQRAKRPDVAPYGPRN